MRMGKSAIVIGAGIVGLAVARALVSQNGRGELTIGDSHEYGLTHDPWRRRNDAVFWIGGGGC